MSTDTNSNNGTNEEFNRYIDLGYNEEEAKIFSMPSEKFHTAFQLYTLTLSERETMEAAERYRGVQRRLAEEDAKNQPAEFIGVFPYLGILLKKIFFFKKYTSHETHNRTALEERPRRNKKKPYFRDVYPDAPKGLSKAEVIAFMKRPRV